MMINPITNAAVAAPRVTPDTLPLAKYSRIMSKKEPKRMAINGRKNVPMVNSFGFGRFDSGDLLIVLQLIFLFPRLWGRTTHPNKGKFSELH
jgi:hypothetical protein